jgi:hypothetical protein
LSRRSTDVSAWALHFGARKLRVDEGIAELERAQRIFLESCRLVEIELEAKTK